MTSVGLSELCSVLRTKNAGPYLFTLDIIFRSAAVYEAVKRERLLSRELIAAVYGIPVESVVVFETFDAVCAVKATMRRPKVAGSPGDPDVYAKNQEAPVLAIRFPSTKLPS